MIRAAWCLVLLAAAALQLPWVRCADTLHPDLGDASCECAHDHDHGHDHGAEPHDHDQHHERDSFDCVRPDRPVHDTVAACTFAGAGAETVASPSTSMPAPRAAPPRPAPGATRTTVLLL